MTTENWWEVAISLDAFELEMEKSVPNPGKVRIIDYNHEYSLVEIRALLQQLSSSLSILYRLEGRIAAQVHGLKEGYKYGMTKALARTGLSKTIKESEAAVLASEELFQRVRELEINLGSTQILVHGWVKAYEAAYVGASRMVTLDEAETNIQSNRFT